MGNFYDTIPEHIMDWIRKQHIFHVATAPMKRNGHVNVSPKGLDTFQLVDEKTCWYQDLSGSGNETISHIYDNGRMTIMFQAFEGAPRILRLYGKGTIYERGSPEFASLLPEGHPDLRPGARSIIKLDIEKVGTSCGFAVPFMDFVGDRDTHTNYCFKAENRDRTASNKPFYLKAPPTGLTSSSSSPSSTPSVPNVPITDPTPPKNGLLWNMTHHNGFSLDGLTGLKMMRGGEVAKSWGIEIDRKIIDEVKGNNNVRVLKEVMVTKVETRIWIMMAVVLGFFLLGMLLGVIGLISISRSNALIGTKFHSIVTEIATCEFSLGNATSATKEAVMHSDL